MQHAQSKTTITAIRFTEKYSITEDLMFGTTHGCVRLIGNISYTDNSTMQCDVTQVQPRYLMSRYISRGMYLR